MKKLLLSLAVAAMAVPALNAQTFNDILGIYSGSYLGYDVFNDYETFDGFLDDVEIEAGSEANEVVIWGLFPEIADASVKATYDEATHILTLPEQKLNSTKYLVIYDWDIDNWADYAEFEVDEDGTISMINPSVEFYGVDDDWTYYMNVAEIVLFLEEKTGNQPGEEPGEEPGDLPSQGFKIGINPVDCTIYRIANGQTSIADPSSFFALVESDSDPMVTLEALNIGSSGQVNLNNITTNPDTGDTFNIYTGQTTGGNVPNYVLTVPDGYVITKVSATLYSLNGNDIPWYVDDEEFVSSASGTTVDYVCNSPIVEIQADYENFNVQPTEWADFFVFVAEEGSSAVKGLESVDANAPVEFFDLQGRKVVNPSNGIFIRRQGNQTSKVVVK